MYDIDLLHQLSIGRPRQRASTVRVSDELHSTFTSSSHCLPCLILFNIEGKWNLHQEFEEKHTMPHMFYVRADEPRKLKWTVMHEFPQNSDVAKIVSLLVSAMLWTREICTQKVHKEYTVYSSRRDKQCGTQRPILKYIFCDFCVLVPR